jgi:hypothetical protein
VIQVLLAQKPIVVDIAREQPAAQDISIQVVLGMFAMAGVLLAVAAVGCTLVAGGMFLYKRWRDASMPPSEAQHSHTRLRIS